MRFLYIYPNKRRTRIGILCLLVHLGGTHALAQERKDTVKHIQEVTISAPIKKKASTIPVQQLSGKELKRLSVYSVADALRYFSGVQIKDYGGIGGLKTVNVRSLGTNHTGVFYNGVQLGNAQNGQIDLGRFSLDNMEAIELYNGQKTSMLQSAKDYASASAIYMRSRTPSFMPGKNYNLNIAMKGGSFDTYNPSVLWEQKLSKSVSSQVSAEYMTTSGQYKFRYAKKGGYDTTEVRRNGDVQSIRVETTLFGQIPRGEWKAQVYFYDSERGFPGASVREEPGKFRHQDRQWDTSVFAQASWQKDILKVFSLLISGKASYDYLHYLSDPNLDITTMYTNNKYKQTEAYLSASHLFRTTSWLSLSLANDVQYNYLDANLTNFVYPSRWSILSALSAQVSWKKLSAQASLLHTYVMDATGRESSLADNKSVFSPTVAISYQAYSKRNGSLNLRAFYKRVFRMPTFNDLYYTFIGNKALKPEFTTQYNIGATFQHRWTKGILSGIELNMDAYYNEVEDKIVAMPTSNQFRWTMMNFGLCHIYGIDATAKALWRIGQADITTQASYTFNKAMDHTYKESEFYGGQLPYIPWHAFSAIVSGTYRGWSANYSFIYTGERYESSANIPENYSKPWYTSDLSISKELRIKRVGLHITGEVCNIFNQQYEVVQCYPMPGTNFKMKVNVII